MPATPIYALRYPAATDPADVPSDMLKLAGDVESKLGGVPLTALPGSPVDGQVIRYKVAADGPVWTLQYVAGSAAPYRWHFIGGAPLYGRDDPQVAITTNYPNMAFVNPAVTAPLAGRYRIRFGCTLFQTAALGVDASVTVAAASPADGSNPAITIPPFLMTLTTGLALAAEGELTRATSGRIGFCHSAHTTGNGSTLYRWLEAMPVVVG